MVAGNNIPAFASCQAEKGADSSKQFQVGLGSSFSFCNFPHSTTWETSQNRNYISVPAQGEAPDWHKRRCRAEEWWGCSCVSMQHLESSGDRSSCMWI